MTAVETTKTVQRALGLPPRPEDRSPARRAEWRWRTATASLRKLPDFLVIGARRAGTTSLYRYLTAHPAVTSAYKKEVHFFDHYFDRGLAWYRAHFPLRLRSGARGPVTGDATPYYLYHPAVPGRVRALLPGARLIALLRNPVDRAFSHYQQEVRAGNETLSFEEAIDREAERLAGGFEGDDPERRFNQLHYSYLSRGIYADQLERWLGVFPREQLLVLNSDDLFTDPAGTLERTLRFLELPVIHTAAYRKYNAASYEGMAPAARARLEEFFAPHNRRLAALLEVDFEWTGGRNR